MMRPEPSLILDLGGRLHHGDKVLPMAPASLPRAGTTGDRGAERPEIFADCAWRETTMEAHQRQRGTT